MLLRSLDVDGIPKLMSKIGGRTSVRSRGGHAAGIPCVQPIRLLTTAIYRKVLLVNTEAALALAADFNKRRK